MDQAKKAICDHIDGLASELFDISRWLYEHPETAYQEREACRYLSEFMKEKGFETDNGIGGVETAFMAKPKGMLPAHPAVAFLAEYDALPKIGHGCGHNLIAAASIGASLAARDLFQDLPGSFALAGTPAEEGGGGKVRLIQKGVFKDFDFALMFHPHHFNLTGENTLGRIKVNIEFFGRSAHAAAAPEKGRNALDALVSAYMAIANLRQQMKPDARVHGIITHGGDAPNVIPDHAAMLFYVRAVTPDELDELFERFSECCHGAARGAGCRCTLDIQPPSLEPMKRYPTLERFVAANMEALGLKVQVKEAPSGSTDAANLSRVMPVVHAMVKVCDEDTPIHTRAFAQNTLSAQSRAALVNGAKILALTAYDYFSHPEIREAAKEDLQSVD